MYALNRDGFRGKYHESRHSRALIGLVIREGVASFMWAAFVYIARYFFKCCFLKSIFRSERHTLKSYNSKGICPFYVKLGEQLVQHVNNKNVSAIFFIFVYFFYWSDFCMITPVCFSPICEMSCIFLLQLNMTKRRHSFLALGDRKPKNKSN